MPGWPLLRLLSLLGFSNGYETYFSSSPSIYQQDIFSFDIELNIYNNI